MNKKDLGQGERERSGLSDVSGHQLLQRILRLLGGGTLVPLTCATTLIGQVWQQVEMGSTPALWPPDAPHPRWVLNAGWQERKYAKDAQDMNEPVDA